MFLMVLISSLLGILAGIITGITPGIHVNLVCVMVLSLLSSHSTPTACFIFSLALTHTFLNTIPSIYLGVPDSDSALCALPGHRLLLKGKGHLAVYATLVGSFLSFLFSLFIITPFYFIVKYLYNNLNSIILYILITITLFLFFREKQKKKLLLITLLSSILGIITLSIGIKEPLFPLLSGLFGTGLLISTILNKTIIPAQIKTPCKVTPDKKTIIASLTAGTLSATLPGIGSGSCAVLFKCFFKKINDISKLIFLGGINTASLTLSLIMLLAVSKTRNGAMSALSQIITQITTTHILLFLSTGLFVTGLATITGIFLSRHFCSIVSKINYTTLSKIIILTITALVYFISGITGLIILITASAIGFLAVRLNIPKHHMMSCIIIPVILYLL